MRVQTEITAAEVTSMKIRIHHLLTVFLIAEICWGQTALDGVSFQASTYNLPGAVGAVRLIDVAGSSCRTAEGLRHG